MTLVSKLRLQLKEKVKKQAKLYSTTMYTASRWRERAGVVMKGKGREMETPVKQESFLARGYTWAIADHRETGGGGGGRDASPDKEDNHIERSSTAARTSRTNTHRPTRKPFSHTDLTLSHRLPLDRHSLSPSSSLTSPFFHLLYLISLFQHHTINLIFLRL